MGIEQQMSSIFLKDTKQSYILPSAWYLKENFTFLQIGEEWRKWIGTIIARVDPPATKRKSFLRGTRSSRRIKPAQKR
jgi:hypothetical protein